MIHLHCTRKLLAKLPVDGQGRLPSQRPGLWAANDDAESPLGHWHGNLLLIQRRQCLLLVHDATRFPVFIPALTKPDFAALECRFTDSFLNALLKAGADEALMQRALASLGPLVCDSVCNRSVQGTLNQMGQDLQHMLDYDGLKVAELTGYRQSAWLADRPCSIRQRRGVVWPVQAMRDLLQAGAGGMVPQAHEPSP